MTLTFTLFPAGRGFLSCTEPDIDDQDWAAMCDAWRRWAWSDEGLEFLTQDIDDSFRRAEFRFVGGDLIVL